MPPALFLRGDYRENQRAPPPIYEAAVASGTLKVLVDVRETVNRSNWLKEMKFIDTLSVNRELPIKSFKSFTMR